MTQKLTFHHDAGHGWLEVPIRLLNQVGVQKLITKYSYFSPAKQLVYLEEDLDALKFLNAAKDKDLEFEIHDQYHSGNCFIRNLTKYKSGEA